MLKRECGTCTKCCEGYLTGEALGKTFYPGKPCHFVVIGKGCSIYAKRPKEPCVSYKCQWLINEDIPLWMKPSDIDAIIDVRKLNGVPFLNVKETGAPMQAKVLSWVFQYILEKGLNAIWEVNGGLNWAGSPEFVKLVEERNNNLNK